MYKKGILVGLLVCSMSMTGCIVINTGKADNDTKAVSYTHLDVYNRQVL